jgi:hypothetical protein
MRAFGLKTAELVLLLLFASLPQHASYAQNTSAEAPAEVSPQTPTPGVFTGGLTTGRPYEPITAHERLHWALRSTIGPESLAAGVFSAGIGTAENDPVEFGPSWPGFGKRYGMRLSGIAAQNILEASFGSIWGEDPRYERLPGFPIRARIWNTIKMTFVARYHDGSYRPAFARLGAISGGNLLSDEWRTQSETNISDTAFRVLLGVLGRMSSNAFVEFWPDVRKHIRPEP